MATKVTDPCIGRLHALCVNVLQLRDINAAACSLFSSALLVLPPPRRQDELMGNTADLDLAIIARYLVAVTAPPAFIGQALRICLYNRF